MSQTSTKWLQTFGAPTPRVRLFCFPYAGGGASAYRLWAPLLPDWLQICAVQLPGRENRFHEAPLSSLSKLIDHVVEELHDWLGYTFAFFGHSTGALISFELARELRRRGLPSPCRLILSGRDAPQHATHGAARHTLADEDFIAMLRRYGGTSEEVLQNRELMDFLLPVLRADVSLNDTYIFADSEPLDCAFSVYGGDADPMVTPVRLEGWKQLTRREFRMELFPGGHFFLHTAREAVVRRVAADLGAAAPLNNPEPS